MRDDVQQAFKFTLCLSMYLPHVGIGLITYSPLLELDIQTLCYLFSTYFQRSFRSCILIIGCARRRRRTKNLETAFILLKGLQKTHLKSSGASLDGGQGGQLTTLEF